MTRIKNLGLSFATISVLTLTGCNSSDDKVSQSTKNISFSGVIVDGYIKDADVFLDIDGDGLHGANEPSTQTDENGSFTFDNVELDSVALIPVIAYGGVDTATGKDFQGELKNIVNTQTMTENTPLIVTPLTDLSTSSFLQSSTKDITALENSKADIASAFELSATEIAKDPMKDAKVFSKVQEIQQIKALVETTATKSMGTKVDDDNTKEFQKQIKELMVKQIKETGGSSLDIQELLLSVEDTVNINIPDNEKSFVSEQVSQVKTYLQNIAENKNIEIDQLKNYQVEVEKQEDKVHVKIQEATEGNLIEIVNLIDKSTKEGVESSTLNTQDIEEQRPIIDKMPSTDYKESVSEPISHPMVEATKEQIATNVSNSVSSNTGSNEIKNTQTQTITATDTKEHIVVATSTTVSNDSQEISDKISSNTSLNETQDTPHSTTISPEEQTQGTTEPVEESTQDKPMLIIAPPSTPGI